MTRNETGGAEGQAGDDVERAASARDRSRDEAVPAGTAPLTTPGAQQRLGAARLRDELATRRDQAAEQRDELADQRDHEADLADRAALELALEHDAGIPDERAQRTRELHERGLEARDRAARDRERAKHDRTLARADRVLGESDRADQNLITRRARGRRRLSGARS